MSNFSFEALQEIAKNSGNSTHLIAVETADDLDDHDGYLIELSERQHRVLRQLMGDDERFNGARTVILTKLC